MNRSVERRLLLVWLGLSAITVLQLWLSSVDGRAAMAPDAGITLAVIMMALVKVRFIVREFMEVRHAPALLRGLMDGWLAITAVSLLVVYFVGMGLH